MGLLNLIKTILTHPLNRGQQFQALLRYVQWQIGSRLVPGDILYRWVNNTLVIVRPGEHGFTQNIYWGLQEFEDMAYVLHVVNSEDIFVDIGANIGPYTILACAAKRARGYCFEPVPSTFERLLNNLRINDLLDSVQAYNMGLGNKDGELLFTLGLNTSNHVLAPNEKGQDTLRVKVRPLDMVITDTFPTIIKVDVEGYEMSILQGMPHILENPALHSMIVELNGHGERYGFSDNDIIQKMSDFGFYPYTYKPFDRQVVSIYEQSTSTDNVIFIRNMELVQQRLHNEPPIIVLGAEI